MVRSIETMYDDATIARSAQAPGLRVVTAGCPSGEVQDAVQGACVEHGAWVPLICSVRCIECRAELYSCSGETVGDLNTRLCKVNSMTAVRFDLGLVTQFPANRASLVRSDPGVRVRKSTLPGVMSFGAPQVRLVCAVSRAACL